MKRTKLKVMTAIAEHHTNTGHRFAFDRTTILSRQNICNKRPFHEMTKIKKKKNCVTKRTDIDNFNAVHFY